MTEKEKPQHLGHRARIKDKFLHHSDDAFEDYELLELMLTLVIPRCDVKPLAKSLMDRFGSLAKVCAASVNELTKIKGIKENTAIAIKIVRQTAVRMLKSEVIDMPVINSWNELVNYCRASIGYDQAESAKALFLNSKNRLLKDELINKGTVDFTPLFPREIVKKALELGATGVILVHNHPSGECKPSREDIKMTEQLKSALQTINVSLHEHLIVSQKGYYSFYNNQLL